MTKSKVKIRALKPSDVKEGSRLLLNVIKDSGYYTAKEKKKECVKFSARELTQLLKRKDYILKVAEVNGKLAGIVVAYLPALCWIHWVATKKNSRRKGVGSLLLKSLRKTRTEDGTRYKVTSEGPI